MNRLVLLVLSSSIAFALPQGANVKAGSAQLQHIRDNQSLQIQAQGKTIIEWQQFDIGLKEQVVFQQDCSKQAILNRVSGQGASQLLGQLSSNCPIYLFNPNGVFIGSSAQVQTASFLASTADITDESFLSNDKHCFENLSQGTIVNLGTIQCPEGDVLLIARVVDHQGHIEAKNVTFTTSEIVLRPNDKTRVHIRPGDSDGWINNAGTIRANDVFIETQSAYSKAINLSGQMDAIGVEQENGRIYLCADKGTCYIDGQMNAPGGQIKTTGKEARIQKEAIFNVSADAGGGEIDVHHSKIFVEPEAQFLANGKRHGNGGTVKIASDEQTEFFGKIKARGGDLAGDGGSVRISTAGESYLVDNEKDIVDTRAPMGKTGTTLFDPKYLYIQPTVSSDPATGQTFSSNASGTATISGDTLATAINASNVVIQANTDISFIDEVTADTLGNGLELQAGRSILMSGTLTLNGAILPLRSMTKELR